MSQAPDLNELKAVTATRPDIEDFARYKGELVDLLITPEITFHVTITEVRATKEVIIDGVSFQGYSVIVTSEADHYFQQGTVGFVLPHLTEAVPFALNYIGQRDGLHTYQGLQT